MLPDLLLPSLWWLLSLLATLYMLILLGGWRRWLLLCKSLLGGGLSCPLHSLHSLRLPLRLPNLLSFLSFLSLLLGVLCLAASLSRWKWQSKHIPEVCDIFGLPWGWDEACKHTWGGDESCELFMASEMFHNETKFLEVADRSETSSRNLSAPYFRRLKQRIVEATLEERPLSVLALGPSTTHGAGCPDKRLRWSNALQNLSNFRGSPLNLSVMNEAIHGSKFKEEWYLVLSRHHIVDLIVIDYAITAKPGDKAEHDAVVLLHAFIQNWTHPPAILFLENFNDVEEVRKGKPCNYAKEFEREDAFYSVAKELQIPMLSYPDIACHLPALNRTSRSTAGGAAYYHSYGRGPGHFGCGVHFILAQAVHVYLLKLLQDSCGANTEQCPRSLRKNCTAGLKSLLEKSRLETPFVPELSADQICQINPQTIFSCNSYGCNFPALVSAHSTWKLGSDIDKTQKFGWVANAELKLVPQSVNQTGLQEQDDLAKKYNLSVTKLPDTDILILLRLSMGTVFLDYLATYENIGPITCQLEDFKGREIGPSLEVDPLWSRQASLKERVKISAMDVHKLQEPVHAVLRCREHGQKFKLISVMSC